MQEIRTQKHAAVYWLLSGCIVLGVLLAIVQFVYNRSLWLDEASLALNILERSFGELLKPLDYLQVAPIGFLLVEKIMVAILGPNEFVLRIFPLFCFLLTIPLFYLFTEETSRNKLVALTATSIFSLTLPMISYASEVKQYMTEVLVCIALLAIFTTHFRNHGMRILLLSLVGTLAIWFSHTAVFVLFGIGITILWNDVIRVRRFRYLVPLGLWLISFLIYYVAFIQGHPSENHMQNSWSQSFMPLNPLSYECMRFIYGAIRSVFAFLLGFQWAWMIPACISLLGLFTYVRAKKYSIVFLLVAPMLAHLLASALTIYPFTGRFILYLIPLVIVFSAEGIMALFEWVRSKSFRVSETVLLLPVLTMLGPIARNYPIEKEEMKKSLQYIETHIKPEEKVYVYFAAQRAIKFYQVIGFTSLNTQIIIGSSPPALQDSYDPVLSTLDDRIWMLFSHDLGSAREAAIIQRLEDVGAKILSKLSVTGSACYYVDLGKRQ